MTNERLIEAIMGVGSELRSLPQEEFEDEEKYFIIP
jgi:predicted hydrolase (HD superfamily)